MKIINQSLKIILAILAFSLILLGCDKNDANTAPDVKISNLVDGKVYLPGEEILVKVAASDKEGGLKEVRLFINNELKNTVTSAPYDIIWKTWGNPTGKYELKAVAVDQAGKTKENIVNIYLKQGVIYTNLLYNMDLGYLTYQGKTSSGTHSLDVIMYSSSVIPQKIGNGISIGFFCSSSVELNEGTYAFDPVSSSSLNTFDYTDYFINFNLNTKIGEATGKFGEGYSLVAKSGTKYKIFISGKNTNNEPIKCYYEGVLYYEDKSKP